MRRLKEHWKTKLICLVLAVIVWGVVKEHQQRGFLRALFTGNLPGETAHAPAVFTPAPPPTDNSSPSN